MDAARSEFEIAKRACCLLHKQDIPEVQAVISLLDRPLARELRSIVEQTQADLGRELEQLDDELGLAAVDVLGDPRTRDENLAALLAALLLSVQARAGAPVSARLRRTAEIAVQTLLDDGAASVGLPPISGPRRATLSRAAVAELEANLRDTVLSRAKEIEEALENILTSRQARQELTALQITALGPRTPGAPPRSAQEARDDLRAALGGTGTTIQQRTATALDSWGYQWYVIGQFEAGIQSGIRAFEVQNNPPLGPDERTTAFCRWVDGRLIPASRAQAQVDAQVGAAMRGNVDGLRANWPFLDSRVARGGTDDQFVSFFNSVGLPPFHFGCRDVVRPVGDAELAQRRV